MISSIKYNKFLWPVTYSKCSFNRDLDESPAAVVVPKQVEISRERNYKFK